MSEKVYDIVDYLIDREFSSRLLSKILHFNKFFKFRGWQGLKKKIEELEETDPETIKHLEKLLDDIYLTYLESGPKAIQFRHLKFKPNVTKQDLLDKAQEIVDRHKGSLYQTFFPYPVSKEMLEDLNDKSEPIEFEKINDNIYRLWVSNRKAFNRKKEFNIDDLPSEMRDYLKVQEFNVNGSVIAVGKDYKQSISYIDFDFERNLIIFFSDTTALNSDSDVIALNDMITGFVAGHFQNVIERAALSSITKSIQLLYSEVDGRIIECGHFTDTGSINQGKLDKTLIDDDDLRSDLYHQGGMRNINHRTQIFSIKKTWDKPQIGMGVFYKPTVHMKLGSYLDSTRTTNLGCFYALISNCSDKQDIDDIISKIISHNQLV